MSYQAQYERWLHSPALSQPEKDELAALSHNAGEIEDRFFSLLQFGTAGLRGVILNQCTEMSYPALREAIDCLPEQERKTILLRFFKGLTQEQAARLLHVSQVQVSRMERRSLQKLRELLSD